MCITDLDACYDINKKLKKIIQTRKGISQHRLEWKYAHTYTTTEPFIKQTK